MRKYAVLMNYVGVPETSIIFHDDTDPEDRWHVLEKDITLTNASTIVEALNKAKKA